jgi:hypothetical protein
VIIVAWGVLGKLVLQQAALDFDFCTITIRAPALLLVKMLSEFLGPA